jgi:D-inositol-3-phosphate glycosyltransferase
MKICFIIEYYHPHIGGAEVLFQNLAEGLVRSGHECEVVTCRLPGTPRQEVLNGVTVHRVWVPRRGDRYWFTLLSLPAAWERAKKADLIHTMTYNGAFSAWVLSKVLRKPVVMSAHEVIGEKWYRIGINPVSAFLFRTLERCVLVLSYDAYSCISKNTMKAIEAFGIDASKLFLAYPGIDHALFDPGRNGKSRSVIRERLGLNKDAFVYIFYGRPGFVKGVEFLVRAAPHIREKVPGSTLLLVLSRKPEPGYQRVLELIRTLGLEPGRDVIVHDTVARDELPGFIQASDCVVVPSLNEGFGFTCAEACAMGKPVVATKAGSLPEVISGKYVLVEPADAGALAEGVIAVHDKRYAVSEKKNFSWDDYVARHVEAYERLLRSGRKS